MSAKGLDFSGLAYVIHQEMKSTSITRRDQGRQIVRAMKVKIPHSGDFCEGNLPLGTYHSEYRLSIVTIQPSNDTLGPESLPILHLCNRNTSASAPIAKDTPSTRIPTTT